MEISTAIPLAICFIITFFGMRSAMRSYYRIGVMHGYAYTQGHSGYERAGEIIEPIIRESRRLASKESGK